MACTLWKAKCAVQALMFAILMTCVLFFAQIFVKLLQRVPRKFVPKSVPEKYLIYGFSPGLSYKSFKEMLWLEYLHSSCPLKNGVKAPNINILTLENVKMKLLDFEKVGRPLVVNFGSCS